jgi:hypothetical protein
MLAEGQYSVEVQTLNKEKISDIPNRKSSPAVFRRKGQNLVTKKHEKGTVHRGGTSS